MFLAMNRFKIVKGREEDFETIWRERDTHLQGVDGFKEFNLLKGRSEEIILYMLLIAFGNHKNILLIGLNQKLLGLPIKMQGKMQIFI